MHVLKRRAIVFFVSDFIGPAFQPERLRRPLGVAARKHDLVVLSVNDPAEEELPDLGLVEAEDAETGELLSLDTSDPRLRRRFAAGRQAARAELERLLRQLGVDLVPVCTDEDFTPALHRFFRARARRYR